MARPFLKWAGGKRQMIPAIEERLPRDLADCDTYVEPFIGGGALMFHLLGSHEFDNVHISDLNPELVLCYEELQRGASGVYDHLSSLIESYPSEKEDRKPPFYAIRSDWNTRVGGIQGLSREERSRRAAQTLFLNKTCFNGLFRVNRKGEFNVPIGSYVNPSFQSEEELLEAQGALEGVSIRLAPFERCVEWSGPGSFVYFDPPYRPLSDTASFVSYSKGDFDDDDQRSLAGVFRQLDEAGARLLLSNSDPRNTVPDDDFFDELYSGYSIDRVSANRAINSNPSKRGPITELLIRNYP